MDMIISLLKEIPDYLQQMFSTHLIPTVIVLAVFLFALLFSNKAANILRTLFVIAALVFAGYGFLQKKYIMIAVAACALIILIVIRLIIFAIRSIRQNRINKRIEERALAKAAKRRGSWKNRQGYSGQAKPIVDEYIPEKMNLDEIVDVLKNEVSDESIRPDTLETIQEIHVDEVIAAVESTPEEVAAAIAETEADSSAALSAEKPAEENIAGTSNSADTGDD